MKLIKRIYKIESIVKNRENIMYLKLKIGWEKKYCRRRYAYLLNMSLHISTKVLYNLESS